MLSRKLFTRTIQHYSSRFTKRWFTTEAESAPTRTAPPSKSSIVNITFTGPDGFKKTIATKTGRNLLQVAKASRISFLPGVCNCQQICSTCHIVLEENVYRQCGVPGETERELLEDAADVEPFSRLSCQLRVTNALDNATVKIPDHYINWMDDDTGTILPTSHLS